MDKQLGQKMLKIWGHNNQPEDIKSMVLPTKLYKS